MTEPGLQADSSARLKGDNCANSQLNVRHRTESLPAEISGLTKRLRGRGGTARFRANTCGVVWPGGDPCVARSRNVRGSSSACWSSPLSCRWASQTPSPPPTRSSTAATPSQMEEPAFCARGSNATPMNMQCNGTRKVRPATSEKQALRARPERPALRARPERPALRARPERQALLAGRVTPVRRVRRVTPVRRARPGTRVLRVRQVTPVLRARTETQAIRDPPVRQEPAWLATRQSAISSPAPHQSTSCTPFPARPGRLQSAEAWRSSSTPPTLISSDGRRRKHRNHPAVAAAGRAG
jgi:hypothetical protein